MGAVGIKYAFTIELPDKGQYGFKLPPKFIKSVAQDIYSLISSMAKKLS